MRVILILNGEIDKKYSSSFFKQYDLIVCVDGGYNNFKQLNLPFKPHFIIGDLDSITDKQALNNFDKHQIIFKDNQDETDSQFAIKFLLNKYKNVSNIDFIYCSSSERLDHLFCNILLLKQIPKKILGKIITKTQEIYLLRNNIKIENKIQKTLSIIPITDIQSISTSGLKWQLNTVNLSFGFIGGISNIIEKETATIELKKGECLLIIEK